jgi:endonuclease YncB( thermonuclease family)
MRAVILTILTTITLSSGAAYAQEIAGTAGRSPVRVLPLSNQVDGKLNLLEGNVVLVYDGDTFSLVARDGSMYTVRIEGIDAPENRQAFGPESAKNLAALIQGMDVVVIVRSVDARERNIGSVFVDGGDVALQLLRRGMAWNDPVLGSGQPADQREIYANAERKARADRAGLWANERAIAPWEFRGERPTQAPSEATAATPAEASPKADSATASTNRVLQPATSASAPAERKYIIGPRGGCYYLNENGVKVYVRNKTLCIKQ